MANDANASSPLSGSTAIAQKRHKIVECYAVVYHDRHATQRLWQEGQLTWYKTDKQVKMFGPKNVLLETYLHIDIPVPSPSESQTNVKTVKHSLPSSYQFVLGDRFDIEIERNIFVHQIPTKPASEDPEKVALRKRVRQFIEEQDDMLAGVLPPGRRHVGPVSSLREDIATTFGDKEHGIGSAGHLKRAE